MNLTPDVSTSCSSPPQGGMKLILRDTPMFMILSAHNDTLLSTQRKLRDGQTIHIVGPLLLDYGKLYNLSIDN